MASVNCIPPTTVQMADLHRRYGLDEDDGVLFPSVECLMSMPPRGKEGIFLKTLDAGYRLPTSDFCYEILTHYQVHINQIVPSGIARVVGFELLCRSQGIVPNVFIFRYFFRCVANGEFYTFYRRSNHVLIQDHKNPSKTWKDHWIWVRGSHIRVCHRLSGSCNDPPPTLFSENRKLVETLNHFSIVADEYPEHVLAGAGMSTVWRIRGKMPSFYVVRDNVEVDVPFIDVLSEKYQGELRYHEVPLVDLVPPSRYFLSDDFQARLAKYRRSTVGDVGGNVAGLGVAHVDDPDVDVKIESTEQVGDSKEGILMDVPRVSQKRKAVWSKGGEVCASDVVGSVGQRLRKRKWPTGSGGIVTGVISLVNEDVKMDGSSKVPLPKGPSPKDTMAAGGNQSGVLPLAPVKNVCAGKEWISVDSSGIGRDKVSQSVGGNSAGASMDSSIPHMMAGGGHQKDKSSSLPSTGGAPFSSNVWEQFDDALFHPSWKLVNGSQLSSVDTALDFALHALPAGTEAELSSLTQADLVKMMRITMVQCACLGFESAARIEQLSGINSDKVLLKNELKAHKLEVSKLKKAEVKRVADMDSLQKELDVATKRLEAMSAEKVNLSQQLGVMAKDKATLELSIGALKIKDKEGQEKTSRLETLLAEKCAVVEKLSVDVEWLLKRGVPGVVNKVFDSAEFVTGLKSFRKACLVAGEALGCDKVLSELEVLENGDVAVDSVVEAMEVALEKFALVDYPSVFGLKSKTVAGLEEFVAADDDEGGSSALGAA